MAIYHIAIFSFFRPTSSTETMKIGGAREIQQLFDFAKIFGVFWIENIQGYSNLDLYVAFNYLVCVWECIKVDQKYQIFPHSQFVQVISQIQKVKTIEKS